MTTTTPGTDRTVVDWLRDNIYPLRTVDPAGDDFSDLEPLRDIVGDARVVSVGESMHRVHEFYQVRHRVARFLIAELGFTSFVMESGFPEGQAVNDWVLGGPGDLTELLLQGITYHMGTCQEMRDQLEWMRAYNVSHERTVRFYGMDLPDSAATAKPAVDATLSFLDDVDPAYAEAVRTSLLPLFDHLPADRTGLAWAAPTIQAYLALEPAVRYELTARIGELTERLTAMRVTYTERAGAPERVDVAHQCAITARHSDAFLAAMAMGPHRTYQGANIRDAAIADNVEWILEREERIILAAANGHLQRWPFRAPPFVNDELTTAGQHLAQSLGKRMVVIATTFGSGTVWLHRPIPGAAPGHTETYVENIGPCTEPDSLDTLLASANIPVGLLDLRTVPTHGHVAQRFTELTSIMNGPHPQPVNPTTAFDAVIHLNAITPWHTTINTQPNKPTPTNATTDSTNTNPSPQPQIPGQSLWVPSSPANETVEKRCAHWCL